MKTNKVAIITAAGRGIGAGIARVFAADGYKLALMSNSGGAVDLAKELGGLGVRGSVTEPGDIKGLVERTMAEYGRIDTVVNNTGHPPKGALLDIPDEDWHAGLDMVMLNVIRMARLVTPIMQAQQAGSLVNISTFAIFEPDAAFPVSCALRAALANYTKMYSDQYAADGIRMNNILPGFVDSYPESDKTLARIPMNRYATTGEIGQTALFLASPASAYITGQNLRVDGGITRSV